VAAPLLRVLPGGHFQSGRESVAQEAEELAFVLTALGVQAGVQAQAGAGARR
jgi:hypothetical protein